MSYKNNRILFLPFLIRASEQPSFQVSAGNSGDSVHRVQDLSHAHGQFL